MGVKERAIPREQSPAAPFDFVLGHLRTGFVVELNHAGDRAVEHDVDNPLRLARHAAAAARLTGRRHFDVAEALIQFVCFLGPGAPPTVRRA
jgi:hypothetical protein